MRSIRNAFIYFALFAIAAIARPQDDDLLLETERRLAAFVDGAQTAADVQHTPRLKAPRLVEVAGEVAVTVSVPLAGDEKHYIRRLILFDENSLVKLKYVATFSARAAGQVQVTALIKMAKNSRIKAIAECTLHGRFLGVSEAIQVGMGGCGVSGQQPSRELTGEVLRVRFRDEGEMVQASLLFRHPMLSGYAMTAAGQIAKSYEPFFLENARVIYHEQTIAEFELGPGLSDNASIAFLLPRLGNEPLKAEVVNTNAQRFTLLARLPQ
jgi:predicted secreted protein